MTRCSLTGQSSQCKQDGSRRCGNAQTKSHVTSILYFPSQVLEWGKIRRSSASVAALPAQNEHSGPDHAPEIPGRSWIGVFLFALKVICIFARAGIRGGTTAAGKRGTIIRLTHRTSHLVSRFFYHARAAVSHNFDQVSPHCNANPRARVDPHSRSASSPRAAFDGRATPGRMGPRRGNPSL